MSDPEAPYRAGYDDGYIDGVKDERDRCVAVIEEQARRCVLLWTPVYGEDRAKARAWDILLGSKYIQDTARPTVVPCSAVPQSCEPQPAADKG